MRGLGFVAWLLVACGSSAAEVPVPSPEVDAGSTAPPDVPPAPIPDAAAAACTLQGTVDLAAEADAPLGLQVDAAHVFFVTAVLEGDKTIQRVPRQGGAATALLTTQDELGAIARWDDQLFAAQVGSRGRIVRVAVDGSGTETLTMTAAGETLDAFGIAVDADAVFYVTHGGAAVGGIGNSVYRLPKSGGAPTLLARIELSSDQTLKGAVVDATHVYWLGSGLVLRADKGAAGSVQRFAEEADGISAFAQNRDSIVYLGPSGPVRVDKASMDRFPLTEHAQARYAVFADESRVVYATSDDGVYEVPLAGGAPTLLQRDGVRSCGSVIVDAGQLLWANTASRSSGGAVRTRCL